MTAPLHACRFCGDHPEAIGNTAGQVVLQHFCAPRRELVSISGKRWEVARWWNASNPEPVEVAA